MFYVLSRLVKINGDIKNIAYGIKIKEGLLVWSESIPLEDMENTLLKLRTAGGEEQQYALVKDFVLNWN